MVRQEVARNHQEVVHFHHFQEEPHHQEVVHSLHPLEVVLDLLVHHFADIQEHMDYLHSLDLELSRLGEEEGQPVNM